MQTKEYAVGGKLFILNKMDVENYQKHAALLTESIRRLKIKDLSLDNPDSLINAIIDNVADIIDTIGGGSDIAFDLICTMMHSSEFETFDEKKVFLYKNMCDTDLEEVQLFFCENRLMHEIEKRITLMRPIWDKVKIPFMEKFKEMTSRVSVISSDLSKPDRGVKKPKQ